MHQHHQHQHQLKSSKAGVRKRRNKMDYRRRCLLFIPLLATVLLMSGYYFVTSCGDACVSKGVSDDSIFHLRKSTSAIIVRPVPSYKTYCADDDASCPSYDNWPMTSTNFTGQRSSYIPTKPVFWAYDYTAFLSRHDVIKGPPKIITWMVKPRYWPELQEPVRMRLCTEMPCRMTTNVEKYMQESAALVWNGQIMRDPAPPNRSHPDQAPVNDDSAATSIIGVTLSTTKAHMVRAILEALAFRFKILYETIIKETKIPLSHIRVDGGVCNNNFLIQLMADVVNQAIDRSAHSDMTSLGAAFLAGLAAGVWKSKEELQFMRRTDRVFQPQPTWPAMRESFHLWERAMSRSLNWYRL